MIDVKITMPDGTITRIRKVSPVQTKRGAEHYERELRQSVLDGTRSSGKEEREEPVAKVPTFAEFFEEYMSNHAKLHCKEASIRAKRSLFTNHLAPFFGEHRLDAIGPREITRYKAHAAEKLHPKSINNSLTVLRRTLDIASHWGILAAPPRMEWLRPPKPEFRFLDFAEAERLVRAAKATERDWWPMIVLALNTGLRLGELIGLPWSAVDLEAGRLHVRQAVSCGILGTPKNGRSREVPLNDTAKQALRAHRHLRGELVFCHEDGSFLDPHVARYPLRRAYKKAGIEPVG